MLKRVPKTGRVNSTREQARIIRAEALAMIESANEMSTATRRVSKRSAYTVISRSLKNTQNLPFSIRKHHALTELSNYIALAKHNKVVGLTAFNTDLLPVSHPRSTKITTMTAAAMLQAQIRWVTDDPRIKDESVKTLLASAMSSPYDSPERKYALTRLENMPQGVVPVEALTAAIGDGNSSAARAARVALQWRDRFGRWVEMFGLLGGRKRRSTDGLRTYVKRKDGSVRSLSGVPTNQNLFSNSLADVEVGKGKIVSVPIRQSEGLDAFIRDKNAVDGFSPVEAQPGDAPVVDESDITFAEAPSIYRKEGKKGKGTKYTDDAYDIVKFDNPKDAQDAISEGEKRAAEMDKPAPKQVRKGEKDADTGKQFWDPEEPVMAVYHRGQSTPIAFTQTWRDAHEAIMLDEPGYYEDQKKQYSLPAEPDDNTQEVDKPLAERNDEFSPQKKKTTTEESKPNKSGFNYVMPKGAYDVDPNETYIPEGEQDDPANLAATQGTSDLISALEDAIAPQGNDPAVGLGRLTDENGDEFEVPAEAIVNALSEQGEDPEMALAKVYDKLNGENVNEKALGKERKTSKKEKAAEPKKLDEIFDEVTKEEPEVISAEDTAPEDAIEPEPEDSLITEDDLNKIPALAGLNKEEKAKLLEDGDYSSFIPKNEDVAVPEGMYAPKEIAAEDRGNAIDFAGTTSELWPDSALINGLKAAMENDGTSPVLTLDENNEWVETPVSAETWRDALALRGRDTNEIVKQIADGSIDIAAEEKKDKKAQREKINAAKKRRDASIKELRNDLGIKETGDGVTDYALTHPIEMANNVAGDDEDAKSYVDQAKDSYRSFLEGKDLTDPKQAVEALKEFRDALNDTPESEDDQAFNDVLNTLKDSVDNSIDLIGDDSEALPSPEVADEPEVISAEDTQEDEVVSAEDTEPEVISAEEQPEPQPEEPKDWKKAEEAEFGKFLPLPKKLPAGWKKDDERGYNEVYFMQAVENKDGVRIVGTYDKDGSKDPYWQIVNADFDTPDTYPSFQDALEDFKKKSSEESSKGKEEEKTPELPPTEPPAETPEVDEEKPKKVITYKRSKNRTLLRSGKGAPFRDQAIKDFLDANGFEWSDVGKAETALQDDEEFKSFARELRDKFEIDMQPRAGQDPIDLDAPAAEKPKEKAPEPTPEVPEPTPTPEPTPEPEVTPEPKEEPKVEEEAPKAETPEEADQVAADETIAEAFTESLTDPEKPIDLAGLIRNYQNERAKEDGALANPYNLNRKGMISRLMWFKFGPGFEKNESSYIQKDMKKYRKNLEELSNEDLVKMLDVYYDEMDARRAEEAARAEENAAEAERQAKLRAIRARKRREKEDELLAEEAKRESEEAKKSEETPAPAPTEEPTPEEPTVENVEEVETPETPKAVRTSVRGADLQPGDVTVKDHFTITNVEGGYTKPVRGESVPASRVSGYYPGSVEQSSKLWADDTLFEVYRGVEPPAQGDLPELRQPRSEDFSSRKDYLDARAKYDEELARRRDSWSAPEVEEVTDTPEAPKRGIHVVSDVAKNLQPGDIAFTRNDNNEPEQFFVITEVLPGVKEYTRPDNGKVERKTTVKGYYPGHVEQENDWNEDTVIEVLRGEAANKMPKQGDKPAIERIANGTLKGKAYQDKRAEIVAARKEAGKDYKPEFELPAAPVAKKPFRPDRPAFIGSAAKLAELKDGPAILEALKKERVVVMDFETVGTGRWDWNDPDAPIQLAGSVYENGEKVDEINLFMNPEVPLDNYYYKDGDKSTGEIDPEKIIDNNGTPVTDEWLATQPSIQEQLKKFADWAGKDAIWVAHNAEFDTNTFEKWAEKTGVEHTIAGVIDTKVLARAIHGKRGNRLVELAEKYGITVEDGKFHNAVTDTEVLKQVLDKLLMDAKPDNKEFSSAERMAEYEAKIKKYNADLDTWNAQEAADKAKSTPEISSDGSTDKPENYTHKSIFGDEINEAWMLDDENTFAVNGGASVLVDELRTGDFIEGRGGYMEIVDIQVDPENSDKLLVYRRDPRTGELYVDRVEDSATPGLGWSRGREIKFGEVRRRHNLKDKSEAEILASIPKDPADDPTIQTDAREVPVKGADLSDEQVNEVVSGAIETITSGAKSGKKVKEAIKDLNVDESIKAKVINREGGSEYHLDRNGTPMKVGDRVRNIKNGRIGTVRAFIGEYGPDKRKNYLKVKFDDSTKRENASAGNLEIINEGDDFLPSNKPEVDAAPEPKQAPTEMNMGMALPTSGSDIFEMSTPSEEDVTAANALPEDNYEYAGEAFPPTPEQRNVVTAIMTGDDVVVRALAGTGKTSTLTLAARRLLAEKPSEKIVYVAFNKTVQMEAEGKMPKNVESRTGDSIAFQGVDSAIRDKFLAQKSKTATMKLRAEDIADELGIKATGVKIKGDVVNLSSREVVPIIKAAVNNFAISDDEVLGSKHFTNEIEEIPRSFVEYANAYWDDITSPKGVFGINNAHITKIWALTNPDLGAVGSGLKTPATVIFFDEAQDINPVIAKVIASQSIQKVYVGDGNQAIYAFRGAEDQLDKTTAKWDLPLTQSFRFGPEVAGMANRFLAKLQSRYRVEGAGSPGEVVDMMDDPNAVITRTNSGGFRAMIELLDAGKTVGITKGTKDELESLVASAQWLIGDQTKFKKPTMHPDLAEFNNWNELKEAVEKGEGRKVKALYDLVVQNGIGSIKDVLNRVKVVTSDEKKSDTKPASEFKKITLDQATEGAKGAVGNGINYEVKNNQIRLSGNGTFKGKDVIKEQKFRWDPTGKQWYKEVDDDLDRQDAINSLRRAVGGFAPEDGSSDEIDVVVTTAHKSKGLQWNNVRIYDDFWGPRMNKKTGEIEMPVDEELRLAYVALTRAQKKLDPGPLNWIKEYTEDEDELPKKASPIEQSLGMSLPTETVTEEEFKEGVIEAADKIDSATELVADSIIKAIEGGVIPWKQPWKSGGFLPTSVATGKAYEGTNVLVLWSSALQNGWSDNRWLTYKQAEKLGGNIKKGEKGTKIIHWAPLFKDVVKEDGSVEKKFVYRPPKVITVFNAEQAEGINLPEIVKGEPVPVTEAETAILEAYKDKPKINNQAQDQAYWSPITDTINLPLREQFSSEKAYLETLIHELTHSTGHANRLNRKELLDNYGSHRASRGEEELIAEIAVAIAAARLGFEIDLPNVASYVDNWLGALKNDKSMVIKAAKQAQKAVDYMLGKAEAPNAPELPSGDDETGVGVGSEGKTGEEIAAEAPAEAPATPEPNVGTEGKTGEEIAAEEAPTTGIASVKGEYQKGVANSGELDNGMKYDIELVEKTLKTGQTNGGQYAVRQVRVSGNTFANRDALKAAGFKYDGASKTWVKSYLGKVFPVGKVNQDVLDRNPDDSIVSDLSKFEAKPSQEASVEQESLRQFGNWSEFGDAEKQDYLDRTYILGQEPMKALLDGGRVFKQNNTTVIISGYENEILKEKQADGVDTDKGINHMLNTLTKLQELTGYQEEDLQVIVDYPSFTELNATNASGIYLPIGDRNNEYARRTILLTPESFNETNDDMSFNQASAWDNSSPYSSFIMAHEFGHYVDDIEEWVDQVDWDAIEGEPSDYARQSRLEFVAEAFAEYVQGGGAEGFDFLSLATQDIADQLGWLTSYPNTKGVMGK